MSEGKRGSYKRKSNCKIFNTFNKLVNNLPNPTNVFGMDSVCAYSLSLNLQNNFFYLQPASHEVVLKLIEEIHSAKSAGIEKIGGRFFKALASLIKHLCNLSIKLSKFPDECINCIK